jgi:hypothetical protein
VGEEEGPGRLAPPPVYHPLPERDSPCDTYREAIVRAALLAAALFLLLVVPVAAHHRPGHDGGPPTRTPRQTATPTPEAPPWTSTPPATPTSVPTATASPTPSPSATGTSTPAPTSTWTPTATSSATSTSTPTPSPDRAPTSAPTTTPTATTPATPTPSPPPSATPTVVPPSGQPCPDWVHDAVTTTGPDGFAYPTWHGATDPSSGCTFGHEHGADPRQSVADPTLPAFGYVNAVAGMAEPHTGFKVWFVNAGETVETNVPEKLASYSARIVFHMGTGGVGRYVTRFHSLEYDYVDGGGRYAHVQGLADTGPTELNGTVCDSPRKGHKDFETLGCDFSSPYEIWNFTRFSVIHPADPFDGIDHVRFAVIPSVALFDPITTRDPADNTRLLYTDEVKPVFAALAPFLGCKREAYFGPLHWWNDAGRPEAAAVYLTDAWGRVGTGPIRQEVSMTPRGGQGVVAKKVQPTCGPGLTRSN